MAFDWREYLVLARWLQTNKPPGTSDECARRTTISRAYFAAFGHSFQYAVDYLDFIGRNDSDDHGRLRGHLRQKRRAGVAAALDRLRGWRNDCDYEPVVAADMASLDAMAASAVDDAEYVFNGLPPPAPSTTGS